MRIINDQGIPIVPITRENIIAYIEACHKVLNENNCPVIGRFMRFKGKDGNVYEVDFGFPIPQQIIDQFPESMKQTLGLPHGGINAFSV